MKTIISWEGVPDTSVDIRRSTGRLHIPVSIISVLACVGAVVAFWAPAYLGILDYFGGGLVARSEALGWSLVAVGAFGLGSVVYLAWRDTRDPVWRAAHGLPPHTRSNTPGH
jgi:hypothetical protein